MKVIEVKRIAMSAAELKKRSALETDATTVINEDTLLVEDGVPILLYKKIDWCDTDLLRQACKSLKYNTATRLPRTHRQGITTRSAIFGYRPRVTVRQDYCSATALAFNSPMQYNALVAFAARLTEIYREYFPETFKHHEAQMERVLSEWAIPGSVFTSGIVNKDNPLQYHHDGGNFKGVLSNMVAFKKNVIGGRLALPEYGIKLEIADNTLTIFDGQQIVHGVTPMRKIKKDGYRYTVVYYSLEQMWKCETIKDEVLRIRKLKLQRELKRITKEDGKK